MPTMRRRRQPLLVAMLGLVFAASGWAQLGDRRDPAGTLQKPLVSPDQTPPAPALPVEQALKSFRLPPGLTLEVVAAEPLVRDPVVAVFGPDGRLWVVEMTGFMPDLDGTGEDRPTGRIVTLSDANRDGLYEQRTVFLDGLVLPRAVLPVADGALVGAPPELAFWADTDGDGKADKKTLVASDYGVRTDPQRPYLANPERAANGLLYGFDNWIYSAHYARKFRYAGGKWESAPMAFRGEWGLSQDDWGHFFFSGSTHHSLVDVVAAEYLQRNPNLPRLKGAAVTANPDQSVWPARVSPGVNRGYQPEILREGRLREFTATCAPTVYRGDLLGEFYGNVFVGEPAAHLVRRSIATRRDGTLELRNAYERDEFITSTDERFRPVNFSTGPDGALYVIDLYRGFIQHRVSLTSYLRQQIIDRKLDTPQHLGRIYRVVPSDRPVSRVGAIPRLTSAAWVSHLENANGWWRDMAQRVIVERGERAVGAAVLRVANSAARAESRMQALHTLEGLGVLDPHTVWTALEDPEALVRMAALRLAEPLLKSEAESSQLRTRARVLTRDDDPEVCVQAVLSLGGTGDFAIERALAEAARRSSRSPFMVDALLSGLGGRESALLNRLLADDTWPTDDAPANRVTSGLARAVYQSRKLDDIEQLFASAAQTAAPGRRAALIDGIVAGAGETQPRLLFPYPLKSWSQLLSDPADARRLEPAAMQVRWPGHPAESAHTVAPLSPDQQARFDEGSTLYLTACAGCHQPNGRGLEGVAPPLLDSEWVLGDPRRAMRIVMQGVRGPIRVLGRIHHGEMPALGALPDEQISSILTFLRRGWGHEASPIDPAAVKAERAATAQRTDAWTQEELQTVK